jgi:hypothetical protein
MDETQEEDSQERRDAVIREALERQAANAPTEEAEYEATRAYWIVRGRMEDAGIDEAQAQVLGRLAYLHTYRTVRLKAEVDAAIAEAELELTSDDHEH